MATTRVRTRNRTPKNRADHVVSSPSSLSPATFPATGRPPMSVEESRCASTLRVTSKHRRTGAATDTSAESSITGRKGGISGPADPGASGRGARASPPGQV